MADDASGEPSEYGRASSHDALNLPDKSPGVGPADDAMTDAQTKKSRETRPLRPGEDALNDAQLKMARKKRPLRPGEDALNDAQLGKPGKTEPVGPEEDAMTAGSSEKTRQGGAKKRRRK
jgi:hypothetical protein